MVSVFDDQCGFVEGKSITDATQGLRIMMKKHCDAKKVLHLVFINLKKAFDRVPRAPISQALRAQGVPGAYVKAI